MPLQPGEPAPELAREGLAAVGTFPTDEELLTVARTHGS